MERKGIPINMLKEVVICKTENFKLIKNNYSSYPYRLEYFTSGFGWEEVLDLRNSDLAELISLIKQYTEEK